MPRIVFQRTIKGNGEKIEEVGIEVKAVNPPVARQLARVFARAQFPTAKNIFSPEVTSVEETEQATFSQLFPETIIRATHLVTLNVVR